MLTLQQVTHCRRATGHRNRPQDVDMWSIGQPAKIPLFFGEFIPRALGQYHSLNSLNTQLLSTEKLYLAKIGYHHNCHVMYITFGWFSAKFC